MIGMAWENTLLASRILPPAYTPVDVATNRSQDASLMLEQDGRLTLLIILTTAAGLAIVLLFFILLRIGCLRNNGGGCFGRYKDRHDRSPCLTVVLDDRASTKSLAASQQTIQTTFVQTKSELDPTITSNYTIKLVDNDLIVETQGSFECGEPASEATNPSSQQQQQQQQQHRPTAVMTNNNNNSHAAAAAGVDQSSLFLFKSWLMMMKSKGSDADGVGSLETHQQQTTPPLETKSLCGSPGYRYSRTSVNGELLANQKQQILARFGQHLPGFGFSQSKSSCLFEDEDEESSSCPSSSAGQQHCSYSYRNGNQVEYMGGPYGYVDPLYSHQLANNHRQPAKSNGVRLAELDIVQHGGHRSCVSRESSTANTTTTSSSSSRQHGEPPLLMLLPTFVRSAESLVVLSKEHRVDSHH